MNWKNSYRQESVPDKNGHVFKVGDGVSSGFNGDSYPYTILYISDSGRDLYVSLDDYKVIDTMGGYVEGPRECVFKTVEVPIEQCSKFTLRKDGNFRDAPLNKSGRSLYKGRYYSQNPSF